MPINPQLVKMPVLKREGNREFAMLGYIYMPVEAYKILEQQGYVKIASKDPAPDFSSTATCANITSIGLEFLKTSKGECVIWCDGKLTEHHNFKSIRSLVYAN